MKTRRSFGGVWAGLLIGATLIPGCGKDLFGPPSRTRPELDETPPEQQSSISLVLPGPPVNELEVWGLVGQREANYRRVMFRIWGPGPSETEAQQPESVRKAIDDGATSLLVVPGSATDLPKALADAEAKKVPVVLLGKEIPAPEGSPRFTVVEMEPFEISARKIVEAILDDVKKAGRPADGTALLVANSDHDVYSDARIAALKSEAEKAGLKSVVMVPFDGNDGGAARKAVEEAVKAHPEAVAVLADDVAALSGASAVRIKLGGRHVFFVGGYAGFRGPANLGMLVAESCIADAKVDDLAKLGVLTTIDRIKGKPGGEKVYQVPVFTRGTGEIATPDTGMPRNFDPRRPRIIASPPPPTDPESKVIKP